ncbi:MAG: hypothetical protein QNJ31_01430 [Candidatus Caenarcaniphilales bacterium]|nr:hypothetical protein [Candidatus Caenarcaniphilales bacterium]
MGIPPLLPINISTSYPVNSQNGGVDTIPVEGLEKLKEFNSTEKTERQKIDRQGQGIELEQINYKREQDPQHNY